MIRVIHKQKIEYSGAEKTAGGNRRFVLCFLMSNGILVKKGEHGGLQVHKGEAVVFPAEGDYSFAADEAVEIGFSVDDMASLPMSETDLSSLFSVMKIGRGNRTVTMYFRGFPDYFLSRALELAEEYEGKMLFSDDILLYEFGALFLKLTRYLWRVISVREESDLERTRKMLNYMRSHLKTVSLEEIAEYFNYHPNTVTALMKKNTGSTFSELLFEMRMACVLGEIRSGKTVSEAAADCGYNNMSNFYRRFKQYYGKTPAALIRESAGEDAE